MSGRPGHRTLRAGARRPRARPATPGGRSPQPGAAVDGRVTVPVCSSGQTLTAPQLPRAWPTASFFVKAPGPAPRPGRPRLPGARSIVHPDRDQGTVPQESVPAEGASCSRGTCHPEPSLIETPDPRPDGPAGWGASHHSGQVSPRAWPGLWSSARCTDQTHWGLCRVPGIPAAGRGGLLGGTETWSGDSGPSPGPRLPRRSSGLCPRWTPAAPEELGQ